MGTIDLDEVAEVRRVAIRPGDTLVLYLNAEHLSMADADRIKDRVRAQLKLGDDVHVLILAKGCHLEVLEPGG